MGRPRKVDPERLREMAEAGMCAADIARQIGVTGAAVSMAAKRHKVALLDARAERMRAMNADPEFNPLALLTPEQRADYDVLRKKGGMTRAEALAAIGVEAAR